jgi:MFS family permease
MLKQFVERILISTHHWRPGPINELAELYWSQFLRSLSLSLVNIFVPIYLYRLGYDIPTIFWFFVCWFMFRPALDIITGYIIARIGPKHTMVLGVFIQLIHLSLLLTLNKFDWPLWMVAITGGWAYGLFILSFEVDFSKVKHIKHGGSELGFASIFERSGAVIGPLIGGFVAGLFGAQYTIIVAIIVLLGSLIPLFLSREPVRTKQQIHYEEFKWRLYKRDAISGALLMLESNVTIILWPLFIGVFVLTSNTYTLLGLVAALGAFVALLTALFVGKQTDKGNGRQLLQSSAILGGLLHILRATASSFGQVLAINIVHEPVIIGYRIPFIKAMFDRADSLPGQRIVYLCSMSAINTAGRFMFWLAMWSIVQFVDPLTAIKIGFMAGAVFSLGIMLERFPSLAHNQNKVNQ